MHLEEHAEDRHERLARRAPGRTGAALAAAGAVLLVGGVATARADALAPERPPEQLVQRGEVVRVQLPGADGRSTLVVSSRGGERTYVLGPEVLIGSGVTGAQVRGGVASLDRGDRVSIVATPAGEVTRVVERQRRGQAPGRSANLWPPGELVP